MGAGKLKIRIEQGATFYRSITWSTDGVPIDLTDATARAQARLNANDANPLINFTCAIAYPLTGVIEMSLTATETESIDCASVPRGGVLSLLWDMEVEFDDGRVYRILQGTCEVSPEITKETP
jgi:hypothetical protein